MGSIIKEVKKESKNDMEVYDKATLSFLKDVIKNPEILKSKDIYKKAQNYIRKERYK